MELTQTINKISVRGAGSSAYRQSGGTQHSAEGFSQTLLNRYSSDEAQQASARSIDIENAKDIDILEVRGEMTAASMLRQMTSQAELSVFDDFDISDDEDSDLDSSVGIDMLDDLDESLPSPADKELPNDETTYISESVINDDIFSKPDDIFSDDGLETSADLADIDEIM